MFRTKGRDVEQAALLDASREALSPEAIRQSFVRA
jgi:hypothetical protein